MKFYSTQNKSATVSLKTAVLSGMPSDGGLYMPEYIPKMDQKELRKMENASLPEIAITVLKDFVDEDITIKELENIIESALNFEIPLVPLEENKGILELFHGPTLAFKDVGARFMSRLMSVLIKNDKQGQNIIVATSGDTGSAVANGFYNVDGIKVFILFPSGKVSKLQQKQMTTLGNNIIPLEIDGNFDDCQRIVKRSLNDTVLNTGHKLTTANSINVARLLPQTTYYFKAFFDSLIINKKNKKVVMSVPSGNFGNLCAGLLATKMGLNIHHFIAATNINDVVPKYLKTGTFKARDSIQTLSNAMDVGNPSNFERILDLYNDDFEKINQDIKGYSFNDAETKAQIFETYQNNRYKLDPHGAVGILALDSYLKKEGRDYYGISLETAHPSKFAETVETVIKRKVAIPEQLLKCLDKEEKVKKMENDYTSVKIFLLEKML